MALLDRNGVYGAQRFSVACREQGVRPIIGSELTMEDGSLLPVLVENRTGYQNLCGLLTEAHLRSEKGMRSALGRIAEFREDWCALCPEHGGWLARPASGAQRATRETLAGANS